MEDNVHDAEKLENFMAITNLTDPQVCTNILAAHNWNLQEAVNTMIGDGAAASLGGGGMPPPTRVAPAPPPAPPPLYTPPTVTHIPARPVVQGMQLPFFLALPVTILRFMSAAFSFTFRIVGVGLRWVVPGGVRREVSGTVRQLASRAAVRPQDPTLAATQFIQLFQQQYGTDPCPSFLPCSYQEALRTAAQELKFLLVYLHSPDHQDTGAYCRNTLCSRAVVDFMTENLVVWGGDIRAADAFQLSSKLKVSTYPFVALISNHNSRTTLLCYLDGAISPEHLLASLGQVLEDQGPMLVAARADVQERDLARQLREEQDREYEASLAADRAREEEQARVRQEQEALQAENDRLHNLQIQEQQRAVERAREVEERRHQKIIALGPEPDPSPQTTQILIRLPNGDRQKRRFVLKDKIRAIYDFVESLEGLEFNKFSLATTFPKNTYGEDTWDLTIEEAGLQGGMMIIQSEDDNDL